MKAQADEIFDRKIVRPKSFKNLARGFQHPRYIIFFEIKKKKKIQKERKKKKDIHAGYNFLIFLNI